MLRWILTFARMRSDYHDERRRQEAGDGAGRGARLARRALTRRCKRKMPRPRRTLFVPDGLWRDVLAFTWTIETHAGRARHRSDAARRRWRARKPRNFHIPPQRTPPRWVTRAGTECIEALFEFETAFGPANGVLRLVPDRERRACAPGR